MCFTFTVYFIIRLGSYFLITTHMLPLYGTHGLVPLIMSSVRLVARIYTLLHSVLLLTPRIE